MTHRLSPPTHPDTDMNLPCVQAISTSVYYLLLNIDNDKMNNYEIDNSMKAPGNLVNLAIFEMFCTILDAFGTPILLIRPI